MNDMIDTSSDLRDLITVNFTEDDEAYEQRARWEDFPKLDREQRTRWEEGMTMEDIFEG